MKSDPFEWMTEAACRPYVVTGDDYWFDGPESRAIEICSGCSVKKQCIDHASSMSRIRYGIWGGLWWYELPGRNFSSSSLKYYKVQHADRQSASL